MVLFNCPTCSLFLEDQDMMKHLSSTRHKTVVYSPTEELLECENCHDSNIHLLSLVRYGGTDLALLCQSCFNKSGDDKPSTSYTIQNGSILKNFENYLRVRDLCCLLCSSEKNLNTYRTNTNMIVCTKCVKEKNLDSNGLVNENDDDFLYVLLGINPPSVNNKEKSSKFKRKRVVGRGRGRGGKQRKRPERPSSSKSKTPSGNSETLRSFQALSATEVSRQRPEDEKGLEPLQPQFLSNQSGSKQRSSGSKLSSQKPSNQKSLNQKLSNQRFPTQYSSGSKSTSKSSGPRQSTPRSSKQSNGSTKKESTPRQPKQNGNNVTTITKDLTNMHIQNGAANEQKSKSVESKDQKVKPKDQKVKPKEAVSEANTQNKSKLSQPAAKSKQSSKTEEKETKANVKNASKGSKKDNKKDVKIEAQNDSKKNVKKDPKKDTKKDSTKKDTNKENNKGNKNDNKTVTPKNQQNGSNNIINKNQKNNQKVAEQINDEDYEEFEHVPKYLKNQPKLSYDSINEYFKEMCFHLYLEEKLATNSITNFKIDYHKENKNLVKLTVPITEEIESMIPEKFRKLGKLPFGINQSLFIARSNDKDNIWDCFIKDLNVLKNRGGRTIELLVELYKWNNFEEFPVGSQTLSIIPCSATISRILSSMARIDNLKFINMLLGKQPIKQLNFKNRISLTNDTFNESQKSAIQHVLNNSITILQGPPGTGKTSTIYEIILQLFRNLKTFPILVVAASNVAIDNIAEKLIKDNDLNVLRIVSSEKEREYNNKHHLSNICLHHQVFEKLPQHFQEVFMDLKFNRKPVSQNQYKKLLTVQNSINEKLIAQAQVILTTTVVAGGFQLKTVKKVPVVIMDESTQSTEASTLIPLSIPGVDRFVFVGDDKQLSSFSDVPYLEQSLFERVLKNGCYVNPHMLNIQYRMHPNISEFPIKKFYNSMLTNGVTDEQRRIANIEPLTLINYSDKYREEKVSNFRRGGGYTYTNKGEAELILRVLKDLIFVKKIKTSQVSLITPYSAQRDLLANLIQKDSLLNPNNEPIEEEIDEDSLTRKKPTTIKTIVNIMISSIDAFQGREKDIIIFSCVRSNQENNIGFVKDARRLNVALTRARSGLILVGNQESLSKGDPLWNELIEHLQNKNYIRNEEDYFK